MARTPEGERDVTYSAETWVRIEVRGQKRPGADRFRMTRDDGGLGHELLRADSRIRWQATGGGEYVGLVRPGDWPAVEAWLKERGVRRVPEG